MSTTNDTQNWIARAIKDLNIDEDMAEDDVVEKVLDLIADVPDGLIHEVAREISRYAVDKQKKKDAEQNYDDLGNIQNAYNVIHEMMDSQREPPHVISEYFRKWQKTAFEVDKWGWMLIHHAVAKRADIHFIEAVAKANPEALYVSVGVAEQTPIQLAARFSSPISVIKALYDAAPSAIRVKAPNGDSPHILACRAGADIEVRAFLYSNRDGPEDDYADMPGLIPVTPPSEPEDDEEEENPPLPLPLELENKDFIVEYARSVGLREAYPVMLVLLAWIFMLTLALLSGTRTAV